MDQICHIIRIFIIYYLMHQRKVTNCWCKIPLFNANQNSFLTYQFNLKAIFFYNSHVR